MLSYLHSFHAGNFADVHKHAVLSTLLQVATQKDSAFAYFDTHAGRGHYALDSAAAQKTHEYKQGIAKLWALQGEWPKTLRPYQELLNKTGANPRYYPGSPLFAAQALRAEDHMILFEQHPREYPELSELLKRDKRAHVHNRDGYEGLLALLPPKQAKRGLVLIDPSYEVKKEYQQIVRLLLAAQQCWAGGTYAIWYPLLPDEQHLRLKMKLKASGLRNIYCHELRDINTEKARSMQGSGMLIINPPWSVHGAWYPLAQCLVEILRQNDQATAHSEWLVPE
ncbi:MAG: 23S rRNA (adenine(2030)-N(6))-methyltransferase RlmJ [Gammaproteobacteria bacterium]|nr:23S rRNA (adenine(2030)-N(6))-methyltransferase RlmJ [Gammaproteobacteria bacterium]